MQIKEIYSKRNDELMQKSAIVTKEREERYKQEDFEFKRLWE